ncbi:MAG: hypothetical protein KDG50_12550 [Chromatiales bacterium]|nr:hypothetical protein [Chromatiales bacterium]
MNLKKLAIATVVIFIVVFAYEWLFHGVLLEGLYERTAELWRPQDTMGGYFAWLIIGQLLFAFFFVWIYYRYIRIDSMGGGARFGLALGALLGATQLIMFAVQPLLPALVVYWIIGGLVEGALIGAVAGYLYEA